MGAAVAQHVTLRPIEIQVQAQHPLGRGPDRGVDGQRAEVLAQARYGRGEGPRDDAGHIAHGRPGAGGEAREALDSPQLGRPRRIGRQRSDRRAAVPDVTEKRLPPRLHETEPGDEVRGEHGVEELGGAFAAAGLSPV